MRRVVIALILALPLTLGTATAGAHYGRGDWGNGPSGPRAAVAGTVVSVDPAAGTIVADAYVLTPPAFGNPGRGWGAPGFGHAYQGGKGGRGGQGGGQGGQGWGGQGRLRSHWSGAPTTAPTSPATTQVTITTNSNTRIALNGQPSTVGALAAGDRFVSLFSGSSSDTIQTLTANPAIAVFAHTPPTPKQLYAFVGTVTATSGTSAPGTVTVTVADSYPSGLFASPATFTVGPNTAILGGNSGNGGLFGGTLGDVSVGDTVAGALVAPAGQTAAQVEALPLAALLDFPTAGGSATPAAKQSALDSTLAMFGIKHTGKAKGKGKHHHRHHKKG
jgi:hypothetical protein